MLPLGLKCFGTIFTFNKLVNLVPGDCRVLTDSDMALVIETLEHKGDFKEP